MFSNEIETSGGYFLGYHSYLGGPAWVFGCPWVPLQKKIHQSWKSAKNRGKSRCFFGGGRPFHVLSLENWNLTGPKLEYLVDLESPKWGFGCPLDASSKSIFFIENHEGGPNKNCDVLKFRFPDPLKAQIAHKGPLHSWSFDRALSFFGVYKRP